MQDFEQEKQPFFRQVHLRAVTGAAVIIGVLVVAWALNQVLPLPIQTHWSMRLIGAHILCGGLLWLLASLYTLNNHLQQKPAIEGDAIFINNGTFAYSRNPIYVSFLAMQLGLGFTVSHAWTLLTIGVSYIILNDYLIPQEEEQMSQRYGQAWQFRSARVKRWLSWPHRRVVKPLKDLKTFDESSH